MNNPFIESNLMTPSNQANLYSSTLKNQSSGKGLYQSKVSHGGSSKQLFQPNFQIPNFDMVNTHGRGFNT